ncbi:MG2 domain-containing protein [Lutibacter sp. TH_r2]|uniref:alpha-2-macroglobulin family protein n=1 Tax=Lutibacter sp. TH_r2 TaxID=3082083 RepID=UPI002952EDF4|nr:MG2 domain-containing protein [Lutibacter sp. TH_r2]MDV7186520.1 MG2 domain-containing protein [Lutibacter sp. TH_r2]
MRFQKIIFAVLFSIAIISCKNEKPQESTDNLFKFKEYINYTTSGVVSIAEPIRIDLAKEVDGWVSNEEISESIFNISPNVEGKLSALNTRSLLFQPSENLKPNKEYSVTVKLSKLYANVPSEYKSYTFKFKTREQNFNITTNNLQSYSKEFQYVEGILKTADVLELEDAKKIISAEQNNKKLKIKWIDADSISTNFNFKIDSIQRFEDDSKILVSWDGSPINVDNDGKNQLNIPGKNNFSIVNIDVFQTPEQHLNINFSDPIKKQQNFNGLIAIKNAKNLKYVVDGNVLKVYPNTRIVGNVEVDVFQGIKSSDGYKLKNAFSEKVAFQQLKPAVRLISSGVILPNSSDLKFNFEAVNLKAVDVRVIKIFEDNVLQFLQSNELGSNDRYNIRRVGRRFAKKTITLIKNELENNGKWKAYAVDLSKMIKADPGAIYRIELSIKQAYSLYKCDGDGVASNEEENYDDYYEDEYYYNEHEYTTQQAADLDEREEQYWDNLIYSYSNNYYNWNDRSNPCKKAYYDNNDRIISANILASNLGVIAKKGSNKSYFFAVTDILTTNPVSGAKVAIYNYQQQEIASSVTDNQGFTGMDVDKNAYFAIVSDKTNKTYLKLDDGYSLSLSKFNVSGKKLQKGLKGFMYGERGVWRPGDSIHLTFVLNDNANPLPKSHPVKLEVTDARGKLTNKQVTAANVNGFYKFSVPTSDTDPTGNWNANISVGGAKFYKSLKVETVKPNRLKIKIDFDEEVLTNTKPIKGDLQVNWLHGAPAKSIKTEVKAKFSNNSSAFSKQLPGYIFNDPTREFYSEEMLIFNSKLDASGNATINKKVNLKGKAPGMLKVAFLTKAFENGGDFSMDVISKNYAPYSSFVGLKSPKEKRYGSFETDANVTFDIATITKDGKPIARNGVEVEVYQIKWRWWWSSSYDNLASYNGGSYHKPFKKLKVNTNSQGKGTFTINVPDSKGGRFLIRVIDRKSGHATGRTAYFYKNWWKRPTNYPEASKMLVFSADKEKYNVGETAKITFPSGTEGRALVSIENGTEVLQTVWQKTQKGETTVEIPITKEMTPNVFINISLLQPHASTANDLPLRLYGVIPILVEDPATRLEPQIEMPKVLKPEEKFTLKVSEKSGKRMTYTIAIVEEGLLDLTRFKTPQIWDAFYTKEALGVKTWDIFDDVIGAYGGSIEQVFAIGGDGDAVGGKNKKANRFKPVVRYIGPFVLAKGKTAKHNIQLPKYIGSVRTMIIAGDNNNAAYGKVDETTPVRKPLMVLSSLPRKLSPGEKVTLPVTVFAMENKVKNVTVSLKLSEGIKVVGEKTQKLTFANPDEKMAYFNLDVSEVKGIGEIEVIAQGNGEKSSYEVEIDVVNPNPVSSKAIAVELEANATQTINFETFGIKGSNTATIEFSTMPAMDFTGRLQYLIRYPHGCVEQTTSSVFPQLYLGDIFDLPIQQKQKMTDNIKNGIERLGDFQTPSGGLSYWMGQNSANDWGTSYAGHFMIEAEKKGFVLPLTFMTNWLKYQKQAARNWRPSYRRYNSDLAQAYRLYTLALAGHPDLGSMNRLREFREISNNAKWRLAAAYALAGQKEAATKIGNTANINFTSSRYDYYTYGSVDRNRAMAMETMLLTGDKQSRDLAKLIAKRLSSKSWMSTQTTAYSLLSMAKMVEINGGKSVKLNYSINSGKQENVNTSYAIAQRDLKIVEGANSVTITNTESNLVFVNVLNSGILPLGKEIAEKRGLGVSVVYTDAKGLPINVSKLSQGTEFIAEVNVANLKPEEVHDIALTEIFPSGWEIVNTRFTDFGSTTKGAANYTDIRDDRVNFYFDLGKNKSKTFKVLLNASYLGNYYLYGVQAEAMYDNEYFTRTTGKWIEVVK